MAKCDCTCGDAVVGASVGVALAAILLVVVAVVARADDGLDLPVGPAHLTGADDAPEPPMERRTDPEGYPAPLSTPLPDEDPPTFYGTEVPAERVVVVLDRSSSMLAGTPSPWDRAKAETRVLLDKLAPRTRFDVVVYSSPRVKNARAGRYTNGPRTYWPASEACFGNLVPATAGTRTAAKNWLDAVRVGGGTLTGTEVSKTVRTYARATYLLLTDGAPSDGITYARDAIVDAAAEEDEVVNTFGVGATGRFEEFLREVASGTGGDYTQVR